MDSSLATRRQHHYRNCPSPAKQRCGNTNQVPYCTLQRIHQYKHAQQTPTAHHKDHTIPQLPPAVSSYRPKIAAMFPSSSGACNITRHHCKMYRCSIAGSWQNQWCCVVHCCSILDPSAPAVLVTYPARHPNYHKLHPVASLKITQAAPRGCLNYTP